MELLVLGCTGIVVFLHGAHFFFHLLTQHTALPFLSLRYFLFQLQLHSSAYLFLIILLLVFHSSFLGFDWWQSPWILATTTMIGSCMSKQTSSSSASSCSYDYLHFPSRFVNIFYFLAQEQDMDHNIPNANVYPCNNLFIARTKIQHKKKGLR